MSRLLVVEDDPDIALALRMLFSRAGYEVAHAGDGRTGLKEAYAEHPDLVVLDVGLPEMDGWQVLERLRRVSVKGDEKRLTPTEFRLLNALVRHAGAVLSPNQLLTQAWDDPTGIGQERVKFAVLRLRRKLGWSDPDDSPIESVRGFGYRYRRNGGEA